MYVRNQNFAIYLILAVIVGFGLSFLFGGLSVQSDLKSGDISKAVRYSNQKEDPSFTVIEEKLRNDEAYLNNTRNAMDFLQHRMSTLSELTAKTMEVCSGIPEFQPLMPDLQSMNARAFNTAQSLSNASIGLDKMAAGRYAPEYELYSNQAYIGFSKVESQMDLGRRVYDASSAYLAGKKGDQYKPLADIAVVWSVYCTQNAYLNGSNKDIDYWKSKYSELEGAGGSEIRQQLEKALAQASNSKLQESSSELVLNSEALSGFLNQAFSPDQALNVNSEEAFLKSSAAEVVNSNSVEGSLQGASLIINSASMEKLNLIGNTSAIMGNLTQFIGASIVLQSQSENVLNVAFPSLDCFIGIQGFPNASQIEGQSLDAVISIQ